MRSVILLLSSFAAILCFLTGYLVIGMLFLILVRLWMFKDAFDEKR